MNHSFLQFSILSLLAVLLTFGRAKTGKVGTVSQKDPQDQNPEPVMKKVEFGGELEKSLDVVRITQGKAEGDLLRIQVELKNISSKEVMLTHKLEWLDQEGFLVRDTSLVWKALMIRPGESKMIESISSRPGVTTFRLKVQPAKNS
jgi:uncharacterized protein YcfL